MSFDHTSNPAANACAAATPPAPAPPCRQGAARLLLTGQVPERVSLRTPKGWVVEVPVETPRLEGGTAFCSVTKDGGDDIDATHGLLITAAVTRQPGEEITLRGGEGVGLVTKPGLDQPVGQWAINSVPRRMIWEAVDSVRQLWTSPAGFLSPSRPPGGGRPPERPSTPTWGWRGASPFWAPRASWNP